MRSIIRRATVSLGGLLLFTTTVSGSALAAGSSLASGNSSVISRTDGRPWIHLGGTFANVSSSDVVSRGRAMVSAHAKIDASSLIVAGVDRFGDGETIVRYAQSHRGLPVIGRGASARLAASGAPVATVVDVETDLPSRVTATLSPADAANVASSRTVFGATANDAKLVIWPTLDRGSRLAYVVLPQVPAGIPSRPRVVVDAETSEVLEVRETVRFAKASMFPSNPTKSPNLELSELLLSPSESTLSNPFVDALNCIDKKSLKPLKIYGLDMNVHTCDLVHEAKPNEDGDYIYEPADEAGSPEAREDAFSEVSIYVHASKAYAFFRDLQGDPEAQVVTDKPLRLVANFQVPAGMLEGDMSRASDPNLPLEPFQNAFFAPANAGLGGFFEQLYGFNAGALWFGQGPMRDYAYDGDVVYHEFVHAVVGATLELGMWHVDARGAIDAPGAMNEALADYFSSAITGDPDVGEYASEDMGMGGAIRTLANQDRCPTAVTGEVHYDSTLFSGALWQARMALKPTEHFTFDAALYKAMRANPGSGELGFDDLAKLFLATLKTDAPHLAPALEEAMIDRGVLPTCERILDFDREPVTSPIRALGFVAPGKQTVNVKGTAPGIIQVRASLPADATTVTVSFNARSSAGGGQGLFGGTGKPFSPVVLAKLGTPITWDVKSKKGHDADFSVPADAPSGNTSATLELPEGTPAGPIFLQIVNVGDSDGRYDSVSVAFKTQSRSTVEEPPSDLGGATTTVIEGGCSSSRVSKKGVAPLVSGLVMGVAALAVAYRRRRS